MTKPNTKKRMSLMILFLVIVFGGIIGFNLFRSYKIKEYLKTLKLRAVKISTITANLEDWYPIINTVGLFKAINGVDVNAQTSGSVVDISFTSSQFVKKGEHLIKIDDSIDQAVLKDNKAQLALQQINYKRQVDLFKRGATPSSNVDEAKANLEQAQASVEKTQAQIQQKHITAPFSGKLGIRLINLGQYITPGTTSIVTLQSLDPLFLEFYLPEQEINKIYFNQPVRFTVDSYPNKIFEAKITAINAKIDSKTHNILLQATLANCPALALNNPSDDKASKLISIEKTKWYNASIVSCDTTKNTNNGVSDFAFTPGMFANTHILLPTKKNVVVLPRTAISYSLYGNSVFLVIKQKNEKTGKDDLVVKRQFVQTGEERGNFIVVNKGVKPGDIIASSGQLKLRNNTQVKINNSVELKAVSNPDSLGQ
jgi:membrane fusion protein, multidrug efflux system